MTDRVREFKNMGRDVDDTRNRRRDSSLELRKNKRVEQTMKKRQIAEPIASDTEDEAEVGVQEHVGQIGDINYGSLPPSMVDGIFSGNPELELSSTAKCRTMLSREKRPPIDDVIAAGIVPQMAKFLLRHENPALQFEAAWTLTNISSGSHEQTASVVESGAVPQLVQMLMSDNEDLREQCLWALGNIAGDGCELRDALLGMGVMNGVLMLLNSAPKLSMARTATWMISNLCRGKKPYPDFSIVKQAIPMMFQLLHSDDDDIVVDCAWGISYITDGENHKIQSVVDQGFVPRLVELLSSTHQDVHTPALRAIGNIVTGTDTQTQVVLDSGALNTFVSLLSSSRDNVRKETAWTISNITAGTHAQIQAIIDANLIPLLISCVENGDFKTRKEAAWAICNLTAGGTVEQCQYVIQQGCIKPLVDLLDNQDVKLIQLLLDGIMNIIKAGSEYEPNPCIAWVEEAGGSEVIENLQYHQNEDVYRKANKIIEKYFGFEEEEEASTLDPASSDTAYTFQQTVAIPTAGFNL